MDSVLTSVKKVLGIDEEYEHFDVDILMHINSVLMTLEQLGIDNAYGQPVVNKETQWTDIIENLLRLEAVKTYVCLKVKMIFDPPTSSAVIESYDKTIRELEWRLNVNAERTD